LEIRSLFIARMKAQGIQTVFHYLSLHSSPAGSEFGRGSGSLENTDRVSDCLVRMPLWIGIEPHLDQIFETASRVLEEISSV
jgi:dTDP-4-amino-4,6-dideoxygalactose transaminase